MRHLVTTAALLFLLAPTGAWAQQAAARPSYFDLGLSAGSFLPSRIQGVTEILPMWGVKMGHLLTDTIAMEYDFNAANAKGVTYYLAAFSLRYDFNLGNVLPIFFNFGFDVHHFKRKNTLILQTEFPFKTTGGWHMGVGGETQLFGDLLGRMDIQMGFGPGRQLRVMFSGIIRF